MVSARAIADKNNQDVIRSWAAKYPNARFILAHAARGFNPHHTMEGIGALRGLPNIWCDTSAVTEAGAFEAIVRAWALIGCCMAAMLLSLISADGALLSAIRSSGYRKPTRISQPRMPIAARH